MEILLARMYNGECSFSSATLEVDFVELEGKLKIGLLSWLDF